MNTDRQFIRVCFTLLILLSGLPVALWGQTSWKGTVSTAVNGDLVLSDGTSGHVINLNAGAGTLTVAGSLTESGGANVTFNGAGTLNIGSNYSYTSGTFTAGSSTIVYNGAGTQTVAGLAYNHLQVNKTAGAASMSNAATVAGDLTVTAGTLSLNAAMTVSGNVSIASGTTLNSDAITLTAGGNWSNSGIFNATGGMVTLNGSGAQSSGATFSGSTFTINLYGNWVNSGTFTPASSTVTLNGTSKTITGTTTFNRMTVYGSYAVSGSDITYNDLLTIATSGSYDGGSGNATVNGDLTNNGSLISNSVTTFTSTAVQTIRFVNAVVSDSSGVINFNGTVSPVLNSTSTPTYATLNINNTGGVTASVGWRGIIAFNISSGKVFISNQ